MLKTLVINDENMQQEPAKRKMKSRAILTNSENEVLIANYGGVFLLPGGSIEEGENPYSAIIRELKEEIGVEFEIGQLKPFAKIKYFQPAYPQRNGKTEDIMAVTYYYLGKLESISENRSLTENERKDEFDVRFYNLRQIEDLLKNNNVGNPRRKYFDRELHEIIKEYKKEKIEEIEK